VKKSIKKYADTNTDFLTPDQFKQFLEDNTKQSFSNSDVDNLVARYANKESKLVYEEGLLRLYQEMEKEMRY
jgi:hypothetical protein